MVRVNAQNVFLTYSQTPARFTPQVLLTKISAIAEVDQYLISQELHQDGGTHLHAYLKFDQKIDKKISFFYIDYYGRTRKPNYRPVHEKYGLFRYIKKDNKYITNIDETRPKWQRLLDDSTSYQEYLEELMWRLNRFDNYAGYSTLKELAKRKFNVI